MERSSPKPAIVFVLLIVCVIRHFEAATAQYGGSSTNAGAATGPMAAGEILSLAVAAALIVLRDFALDVFVRAIYRIILVLLTSYLHEIYCGLCDVNKQTHIVFSILQAAGVAAVITDVAAIATGVVAATIMAVPVTAGVAAAATIDGDAVAGFAAVGVTIADFIAAYK
uniref:CASP-like protein n=1 Tax=Oryza brachyantha TaxID=4533 RepID=J3KUA2_ORYBR